MYTFDEIIASAYFVYPGELNVLVVKEILMFLRKFFKLKNLKLNSLSRMIEFKDYKYELKENVKISSILPYIDNNLMVLICEFKEAKERMEEESLINRSKVKKIESKSNYPWM